MGRPYACSTVTPCAFMATSSAPDAAPKSVSVTHSVGRFQASGGSATDTANASQAARITGRLPRRAITTPVSGIESSDPKPRPNSARPSSAALSPSRCCTAGMRVAQLPPPAPRQTNATATATRAALGTDV